MAFISDRLVAQAIQPNWELKAVGKVVLKILS
jgi:hypothetical protein